MLSKKLKELEVNKLLKRTVLDNQRITISAKYLGKQQKRQFQK
ncbi:hypothetical protein [Flavobacterium sp.]|nr:hypothetical protein [Flavobacterium sp.]